MSLILYSLGILVVLFVIWSILKGKGEGAMVEPLKLQEEIGGETTPVIIDVRSPGEFNGGHLPKARNVPCDLLIQKGIDLQKDSDIVVYCHSGFRSANAQRILRSMGYSKVRNLKGGIVSWRGPVE